jgi:hypothetical protein
MSRHKKIERKREIERRRRRRQKRLKLRAKGLLSPDSKEGVDKVNVDN